MGVGCVFQFVEIIPFNKYNGWGAVYFQAAETNIFSKKTCTILLSTSAIVTFLLAGPPEILILL